MVRMISTVTLATTCWLSLFAGAPLFAGEPPCAACEVGVPLLSKVPYISRLFKNVGVGRAEVCVACETLPAGEQLPCPVVDAVPTAQYPRVQRHIDADGCERIGIDFDFEVDGPGANGLPGICITAFGNTENCASGECREAACPAEEQVSPTGAQACAESRYVEVVHAPHRDLAVENGGLYRALIAANVKAAKLEEREQLLSQFAEEKMEFVGALLEASAANAKLTVALEFAAEREKLIIENAVLKAQTSTPVSPAVVSENFQLRAENAALQAKLAQLEERLANLEAPAAKSADKSPTKRKR